MSPTRRRLLSWGLLYAALFSFGIWRGFSPDFEWPTLRRADEPLHILAYDSRNLKESFLRELEEATGVPIQVDVVSDFADFEARLVTQDAPALLWLPPSWARALANQHLIVGLRSLRQDLERAVSADFRRASATNDWTEVPLLWSLKNRQIQIESVALSANTTDTRRALNVLKHWMQPEIAVRQVQLGEDSSTLLALDQWDLPHERRARSLRDHSFQGLREAATGERADEISSPAGPSR